MGDTTRKRMQTHVFDTFRRVGVGAGGLGAAVAGATVLLRAGAPPSGGAAGVILGGAVAAGWLATAYLALCATVTLATWLPGRLGRAAVRSARALLPTLVWRVLPGAAVGVAVAAGPALASGVSAGPPPVLDRAPVAAASGAWVQPGDSLWSIAAAHLPAGAAPSAVARAWPRWWAANRDVVGPDPGLLRPGVWLVAPTVSPR